MAAASAEIRTSAAAAVSSPRPTVERPTVITHTPADRSAAVTADALYIGPAQFLPGLEPLLAQRRAQGYSVAAVDVAAIYDGWGGGQVSPSAIRNFLRYVMGEGGNLRAVTLVGDATSDPLNYGGHNNPNFVPPYLAMVDKFIGETACESCYAQLDGDDPVSDPLPDLWLGRLPVKSAGELEAVVQKIVGYEQNGITPAAASRLIYVADNFRNADGTLDGAGDFAFAAEQSIALQPASAALERIYYDPAPVTSQQPWHEADARAAYEKTVAALKGGAGFVNYIGHAHYWQWASTDLNADPSYLFGLYDVDSLNNRDALFILLAMTCLTGAFQTPSFSGTTIDERFLLHPDGGSVAVWAPTGFGVAYGHDRLQVGFYRADRQNTAQPVGALVEAGYTTLFTQAGCCQEALHTYALLGDPLTVPQVRYGLQLPLVIK